MVSGANPTGNASGSGRKTRLTRHFFGEYDGGEDKVTKDTDHTRLATKSNASYAKSRVAPTYAAALLSTATQNLSNMVAVIGVSGAVLLTLLAARHF